MCWIDFRSFHNDWMSRSHDSGEGHGHFLQTRTMFIILYAFFLPSSAKIGWYKLSYCFKYFLLSDMTIWGHFHGVKIIFKVTACVILGYLVHWPPCMWRTYIISVWFIFELQLINFIHNSKFGIYSTNNISCCRILAIVYDTFIRKWSTVPHIHPPTVIQILHFP